MKTYIIQYAPLEGYGYSLQNLKMARILSESNDIDYIKSEFEKRCDLANAKIPSYEGMFIKVYLLEDFLDDLPSDMF